ncbi:MAG: ammonium transporter [Phototrophicaceae bacterium]
MNFSSVDTVWIVIASALILLIQGGFLALETGLTRTKNSINVAMKNLVDFGVTTLIYWGIGFGLMFGLSGGKWLGNGDFALTFSPDNIDRIIFFMFQLMFCGTSVTIISGAVAERMRFLSYLYITALLSALIYPVFGHWAWAGVAEGVPVGWLAQMGFHDFAGSSVVHSTGGWASLVLVIIIGARYGRFKADGTPQEIPPSNLPLSVLGTLIMWVGWIGFNGGSVLGIETPTERYTVANVIANTILAGSAGMMTTLLASYFLYGKARIVSIMNGLLVGLVAVTASANVVTTPSAILIGAVGGLVMLGVEGLLLRFRIDDAVGAISVHLGGGLWGTLAVGLFANLTLIPSLPTRGELIGVQLLGIVANFVWVVGGVTLIAWLLNRIDPMRVTHEQEVSGLNVSEHDAHNPLLDLFQVMDAHTQSNDLSLRAPIEPFTEVGRIAQRYNEVMQSLENTTYLAESTVNTAVDSIITFAIHDLRVNRANLATRNTFGYAEHELVGQTILILFDLQDARTPLDFDVMVTSPGQPAVYYELNGIRKDGSSFPMEVAFSRVGNSVGNSYWIGFFRDITQRKHAEQALIEARDLAEQANRAKSSFLANMSHELRTPLNAIMGYSGTLQMGISGQLDELAIETVTIIEQNSERLLTLIDSILDLAKIEAGQMRIITEKLDMRNLVSMWEANVRVLANQKGLEIRTNIDDSLPNLILGDGERLSQIALNLLSNAVKFTHEGSVELNVRRRGEHKWVIQVTDSGIGIPPHALNLIFEEFRQVDETSKRLYGGTGLGLSIVRRLVVLMGGTVTVNSELGRGSTFIVTLPLVEQGATH